MRVLFLLVILAFAGCSKSSETPKKAPVEKREPAKKPVKKAPAKPASDATPATRANPETGAAELVPGPSTHARLLTEAKTHFLSGEPEKAEPYFKQLSTMTPVSSEVVTATIALGNIYTQSDRVEQAMKLYADLIERVPNIPMVHVVVGRAYAGQEKFTEAIGAYRKALTFQPDLIFLLKEVGQMQAQLGKHEEAAQTLLSYERRVYKFAKVLESAEQTPVEDRLAILDVFSMVEDDRVTQSLIRAMSKDPDARIRQGAAKVLGESMAVSARDDLQKAAMMDSDTEVRKAAKQALELMKDIASPGAGDAAAPTRVDSPAKLPE